MEAENLISAGHGGAASQARSGSGRYHRKAAIMTEFLLNNWFWIVVLLFFIWMHSSGMGCGGHGGHGKDGKGEKRGEKDQGHQH